MVQDLLSSPIPVYSCSGRSLQFPEDFLGFELHPPRSQRSTSLLPHIVLPADLSVFHGK